MIKKLGLYLGRWQLSTPILFCVYFLLGGHGWTEVIIANFLGGLIFYNVDKIIFNGKK